MKLPIIFSIIPSLFLLVFPILSQAQNLSKGILTVEGEVLKTLSLSMDDLQRMNAFEVKINDMQGMPKTFKGVRLLDLLDSAGVTLGRELRGENLTKSLLMTAADGYQVIYALAEIDPEFTDQTVLVAYEVDGKELPFGEGPLRIIAPDDKRPARWIRELVKIQVLFPKE